MRSPSLIMFAALSIVTLGTSAFAASPPARINYQGVLRNNADKPLSGTFDLVFSFWDADTAGNQVLVDSHTLALGSAVPVTGGLFSAVLGAGTVTDGSGPGTYTSLDQVFRDYASVWVEVKVGAEILAPRTPVVGAPYAQNTTYLAGNPASSYLDTSGSYQEKQGAFSVRAAGYYVSLARDGNGIYASAPNGPTAAGRFQSDVGGFAQLAYGEIGVQGQGNPGAKFLNSAAHNAGVAELALLGGGIYAHGPTYGGSFASDGHQGYADVANLDYGVRAGGAYPGGMGGYFWDNVGSGRSRLAVGDTGLLADGNYQGGKFTNGTASSAVAELAYGRTAIRGTTTTPGDNPGWFQDISAGSYVAVGQSGYKVRGSGSVSFVQNDPTDASRQVVYTAPEGDEVATYTRGSARLVGGVARVGLGPTFAWVTNPDVGLTAHLTAHAPHADLYVESIGTKTLVVKSGNPAAGDVTFDYIVWGLRIGFESRAVVQPKEHESKIPNLQRDAEILAAHPDLGGFTALSRHAAMRAAGAGVPAGARDAARAETLKASIGVYDAARDAPARGPNRVTVAEQANYVVPGASAAVPAAPVVPAPIASTGAAPLAAAAPPAVHGELAAAVAPAAPTWLVSEPVRGGDLLVFDPLREDALRRASTLAEGAVAGVAGADAYESEGALRVVLADTAYPVVNADASAAPIRRGDALVAGTTPGTVVRAPEGAPAATIVGRAMERLDAGEAAIRIVRR